jgi:hypothetical protein
MTDQPKPPLWRVVHDAFEADVGSFSLGDGFGETCGDPDHNTWAHVIRALAEWLVPEEHGVTHQMHDPDLHRSRQRHQLRNILLDEADRAEAGPGSHQPGRALLLPTPGDG